MPKVLVVEDDKETANLIGQWLEAENYIVDLANTGSDGSQFLKQYEYDVIILDWTLPDTSGLALLHQFRASGGNSPVIFLTGRGGLADKQAGFNEGVDDYLTKPFALPELSLRVKALLRRSRQTAPSVISFKHLLIDTTKCKVISNGVKLQMSPTEYALLEFLIRNPDQVYSADALLRHVWKSDTEATEIAVRTAIARIRQKIDIEGVPTMLETLRGFGYRLNSD